MSYRSILGGLRFHTISWLPDVSSLDGSSRHPRSFFSSSSFFSFLISIVFPMDLVFFCLAAPPIDFYFILFSYSFFFVWWVLFHQNLILRLRLLSGPAPKITFAFFFQPPPSSFSSFRSPERFRESGKKEVGRREREREREKKWPPPFVPCCPFCVTS